MTLPSDKIGDKGQRYEVFGRRKGAHKWESVGWTEDPSGGTLRTGLNLHPGYDAVRVVDRQPITGEPSTEEES